MYISFEDFKIYGGKKYASQRDEPKADESDDEKTWH